MKQTLKSLPFLTKCSKTNKAQHPDGRNPDARVLKSLLHELEKLSRPWIGITFIQKKVDKEKHPTFLKLLICEEASSPSNDKGSSKSRVISTIQTWGILPCVSFMQDGGSQITGQPKSLSIIPGIPCGTHVQATLLLAAGAHLCWSTRSIWWAPHEGPVYLSIYDL